MPDAAPATDLSVKTDIPSDEMGLLVPKTLDQYIAFANLIMKGGRDLIPRGLQRDNPQQQIATLIIAWQYGREVGLSPTKANRCVQVVNGMPSLYGEGPVGIVESRGLVEDMKEEWTGTFPNDDYTCTITLSRKGRPTPKKSSFSIGDAKRANLWGKAGPWTNHPKRMLYHRAKTFAARDLFPDIIGGFLSEDEADEIRVESQKVEAGPTPLPGQTGETKPRGRKKAGAADQPPVVEADFTVGETPNDPPAEVHAEGGGNAFSDPVTPEEAGLTYCGACSRKANDHIAHEKGEVCPNPEPVEEKPKSAAPANPVPASMRAGIAPKRDAGDDDLWAGALTGGK